MDEEAVRRAAERLTMMHGPGAIVAARQALANATPLTWDARWWKALVAELENRVPSRPSFR